MTSVEAEVRGLVGEFCDDGSLRIAGILPGRAVVGVLLRRRGQDGETFRHEVAQPPSESFDVTLSRDVLEGLVEDWVRPVDAYLLVHESEGSVALRLASDGSSRVDIALHPVDDTRYVWAYLSTRGNLSLRAAAAPRESLAVRTRELEIDGSTLRLRADVESTIAGLPQVELQALLQPTGELCAVSLDVTPGPWAGYRRLHGHSVSGEIDLADVVARWGPEQPRPESLVISVEIDFDDGEGPRTRIVKLPATTRIRKLPELQLEAPGGSVHFVLPYLTFKARRLGFRIETHTREVARSIRRLSRWGWVYTAVRPFSGVWLVGELPYKAQDNGAHFFRWLRLNRPRRRAHYVIDPASPERRNVAGEGNIVDAGSRRHLRLALLASRLVSTHHAEYVLPTRSRAYARWARGNRVFLQHGVMGTKNMVANYGRRAPEFATDRFLVSSEFEREMIANDFQYRRRQVVVTGLPRFDRLLDNPVEIPHGLLVVPTWRDWLLTPQAFEESDYLTNWRAVLEHQTIKDLVAAGERVTFILHPNMRQYAEHFDAPGVTIHRQGDVDLQDLIRSHAAMVTDYTSAALDFSFQHRPVFYFQFDRSRFIGSRPSHLDLEHDLPGPIATTSSQLMALVERSADEGFVMEDRFVARADRFIEHRDTQNCERVEHAVRTAWGPTMTLGRIRDGALGRRAYSEFRSSRAYYPFMRVLFKIGRLLPRRDTVVFESWNGKAYGDSPKAIYEELVRRNPGLRTVWVSAGTFRTADPETVKIRRLTPRYFWELSRARWWVNNQNFPHYLKPAARTTYLQTWHGTPLKRMQFDAVSTAGRDEGYLDRVHKMTGYWSMLISPSPYASTKFRSAFRYDGSMLELGYPRNDLFAGPEADDLRVVVRQRLGVDDTQRLVLYAPTFRDQNRAGTGFSADLPFDLVDLVNRIADEDVLVLRMHSVVRGRIEIPEELDGRVIDASAYPDMQELLLATDVLVTDYSSSLFDFAVLRRPMVFFCYDLDEYRDELRGFYLDIPDALPGPVVRSVDELVEAVKESNVWKSAPLDEFVSTYAPWDDGGAAARVVDEVFTRRSHTSTRLQGPRGGGRSSRRPGIRH
ncbi:CDP-glycerol glycerophosphotransferase family protein [Paraoerskovia marina]|uniref:CDP-glycerol glycerophosphotransferase family protein n=1 Tax=Paraoerskovia marina TaxID=545619 RepID=UPI00156042A3|nr:CDP-glycerol glycerophosphotransferase family protein [Paraoerskovia marina]